MISEKMLHINLQELTFHLMLLLQKLQGNSVR